jgi:hypothetical protein
MRDRIKSSSKNPLAAVRPYQRPGWMREQSPGRIWEQSLVTDMGPKPGDGIIIVSF